MSKTYSAGIVTAYGAAKRAGYQGTYEDFCRQQAGYAGNAAAVEVAKTTAVNAASTATAKAGEATTAATAAQTAKTQTEQAASQALTDISTARSGAISAVQTEGQTQTANARAQAQAAAQSATTASTKASEASASATSAGQSATNAAVSATSAAQSASNAQNVLDSIPADYSDLSANVDQLKADLGVVSSFFNDDLKSIATKIENQYVDNNGSPHNSSNWRTFHFDANDISLFSKVVTTANTGNENFYQVSFFSSSEPSIAAFISGIRFENEGLITHTDIDIPSNAVLCCVADRTQDTTTTIIEGFAFDNISVTNVKVKEAASETVNQKTDAINSSISAVMSALTNGEYLYESLGNYYLNSSGVAISSNYWELHKFPVQSLAKIHLSTWINTIASGRTPKCSYAFLGKDYTEIISYNSWTSNDVIETSPIYSEITDTGLEYDLTCPQGAKTLVVALGSVGIDNGIDTIISTYAKRNCLPSFNNRLLDGVATSTDKKGIPFIYTFDETFSISPDVPFNNCMVLSIDARYTGENAPTIRYNYPNMFESIEYSFGDKGRFKRTEIRIAPRLTSGITITVTVPTGTTVDIRGFDIAQDHNGKMYNHGIRLDAHRGFFGLTPHDTITSFEYAALCGYPACITIPKVTSDGVLVCIHDDTINATALTASGASISEEIAVANTSYADLLEYDYSKGYGSYWRGQKLPTVEEFFGICARTGMRPMFSTHPALTIQQWQAVKAMLIRYNLLSVFTVKAFLLDILETAYSVFGNDIDAYVWDDGNLQDMQASTINNATCRKGIELRASSWTSETALDIISAGYFASAWSIGKMSSADYMRLIDMGVTEFTDDYNCSFGLNWY